MDKRLFAKLSVLCLVSILLGVSIGIVYGQSSSNFMTITGGIYPGASTYTISVTDGVYYAKNAYGDVSFADPDASIVFNAVFDALPVTGGTVEVATGVYEINSVLTIGDKSLVLRGQGSSYGGDSLTVLKATSSILQLFKKETGLTFWQVQNLDKHNIEISDISIDGNYQTVYGLFFHHFKGLTINNVQVYNCTGSGIYASGIARFNLLNVKSYYHYGNGLEFSDCITGFLTQVSGSVNGGNGAVFTSLAWGVEDIHVTSCIFVANTLNGIAITRSAAASNNLVRITGTSINENEKNGIISTNATYIFIEGNTITDNGAYGATGYSGVYIDGGYVFHITDNFIGRSVMTGEQDYAVSFANAPLSVVCKNNRLIANRLGLYNGDVGSGQTWDQEIRIPITGGRVGEYTYVTYTTMPGYNHFNTSTYIIVDAYLTCAVQQTKSGTFEVFVKLVDTVGDISGADVSVSLAQWATIGLQSDNIAGSFAASTDRLYSVMAYCDSGGGFYLFNAEIVLRVINI